MATLYRVHCETDALLSNFWDIIAEKMKMNGYIRSAYSCQEKWFYTDKKRRPANNHSKKQSSYSPPIPINEPVEDNNGDPNITNVFTKKRRRVMKMKPAALKVLH